MYILIEFSHNYNMQDIEYLERVKSIAETNFKMFFILNAQNFHATEFLQIFYKCLSAS